MSQKGHLILTAFRYKSKKLILRNKGANFDQKGSKMGVARFFPNCKPQFFKENHKIRFYTKNQQNSTSCLEDIS